MHLILLASSGQIYKNMLKEIQEYRGFLVSSVDHEHEVNLMLVSNIIQTENPELLQMQA